LPAGTYNVLRFFVQSATVTFSSDITVGGASFVSGQTYDLDIPSVDNTGIQITTAHFTVEETSETVLVLFDPAASTASIGATGDGRVRMTPVLRESDQATEDGIEGDAAEGAAAESDEGEGSEEGEEGSSETESGSGSASVLLGSMVSISSSVLAGDVALGGVSRSIIPGGKIAPEDIVSLRLAVCEIRAVGKISAGDEEDASAGDDATSEGEGEGTESDGDAEADVVPACQGNDGGAGWTRIPLETTDIDLFALGEGEVVELAVGELPVGEYHNVRLYLAGAWITFSKDMTFGNTTILAGEETPLRIPSAENSGLKVASSRFEVSADVEESVLLLFDRSSVSSIKATGKGIQMSPKLREATVAEETATTGETEGEEGAAGA